MGSFDLLPPPQTDAETEPKPPAAPAKHYDVRVLSAAEAGMLDHVFRAQGVEPPDQRFAFIVGAVEANGRVSENFLVVQLRVHAEPLNLEPGCDLLFTRLAQAAEETIAQRVGTCDVFLFAPAGKVARMAQVVGMRMEPWVVCSKRVEGAGSVEEPDAALDEQPAKRARVRRKKEQVQ